MTIKRITVAQHERALVWKNKTFAGVLEPGKHWLVAPMNDIAAQLYDLTVPEFEHARVDFLVKEARATMERYFDIVELTENEVGLVHKNGKFSGVLAPGKRQLYWKGPIEVKVEKIDISADVEASEPVAKLLGRARQPLLTQVLDAASIVEVPDTSVALLIVDGKFTKLLEPGLHVFWKYQRTVKVELVDRRMQTMEVSGQDILTKDKVSLRVNLTALWQVEDVVQARAGLQNFVEYIYKELQFALREAIGSRTLDELLGAKGDLDREIQASARGKIEQHGIKLASVGLKDVILPGEMKDILNRVVEAEKVAQANLIKRREETAATRSLLNTARLMDENPTLLRLKELETLEKVTEKVDKLTVFGGLDGVLKDVVRIQVPAH
ncbi:slipin family protein [Steroidobacter sp. S1-65]|uniref:Slipin family protein n=1 Tax=Steroidobacter gossypii TaxID=2805490 RepID=A0ABS1WQI7_9GAMM|nr:slipin family protein [Steroidobacter gossypii]MBM0103245.1 slipin family protein [Steroidobacter gossypii]